MENSFNIKQIFCSIHSKDVITKICMDAECEQILFCSKCLENDQMHKLLLSLEEFQIKADSSYEEIYKTTHYRKNPPIEIAYILRDAQNHISTLISHIESQKKSIEWTLNEIMKKFTSILENSKKELFSTLENELNKLKANYTFLQKKVRRYYNTPRDENIFPFLKDINKKMSQCSDNNQLLLLIQSIRHDIYDVLDVQNEETYVKKVNKLAQEIKTKTKEYPSLIDLKKFTIIGFEMYLKENTKTLLNKVFIQEGSIPDLTNTFLSALPSSEILINPLHVTLIKEWLNPIAPKSVSLNLIYSGRKNGSDPEEFHKKCDGHVNTLTLCQSVDGNIFGGYLDQPWSKKAGWIKSDKAWIFSIKEKKKFNIKKSEDVHAAYGNALHGPTFGGGHDLAIIGDFKIRNGSSLIYSYDSGLIKSLSGENEFKAKEIEIYEVSSF